MYNNTEYDLSKPLMIKRSGDIKNPLNKNKTHINKKWYKSTNINLNIFKFHKKGSRFQQNIQYVSCFISDGYESFRNVRLNVGRL